MFKQNKTHKILNNFTLYRYLPKELAKILNLNAAK